MVYQPDNWILLHVLEGDFYKVLGGWSGGFLHGDSWRLSSGITGLSADEDSYHFYNETGSTYICKRHTEKLSMAMLPYKTLIESNLVERVSVDTMVEAIYLGVLTD